MDRVFNSRNVRMNATHLLCSIAKLPNLVLKLGNFNFEFERFQIQIQFKKKKIWERNETEMEQCILDTKQENNSLKLPQVSN